MNKFAIFFFNTEEEALEWMEIQVDDPYIDNWRVGYFDDEDSMIEYERLRTDYGCCGFFDKEVVINNRKAKIGCNFGH